MSSLDKALAVQAGVFDGLGPFSEQFETGMPHGRAQISALYPGSEGRPFEFGERGPVCAESPEQAVRQGNEDGNIGMVHAVEMLPETGVQRIAMPAPQRTAVRPFKLIALPGSRSRPVVLGPASVRALESFRDRPAEVRDGNRMLISPLPVRSFQKISQLMHRRKSADLQALDEAERTSFLREAEALKCIPVDNAELMGIFRSIPIEIISRLHFVSSRNEIIYSLEVMPGRNSTRVHDMAAVRDTAKQEVHLIPHRTRSRLVKLGPDRNGV